MSKKKKQLSSKKEYGDLMNIPLIKPSNEAKKYLELPYTYTVEPEKDNDGNYFIIKINELPGCISHGKTIEEAYENVKDAMLCWISVCLESGHKVPTPDGYSGKFSVRIPTTLHKELVIRASKEGISLNQLATTAFAKLIGYRSV